MFQNINKNIRKYYNNFQSYTEIYRNFDVVDSYNQILKYDIKNNNLKYKNVIIDGGFYNLGYFYRLQLLRASLYSKGVNEHAYIWDCNKHVCKNILKKIGIKNIYSLNESFSKENKFESKKISKKINSKLDLINYEFPDGVPGLFLYDVVLKGQKAATVNIKDKNLSNYIFKFLCSIKFSKNLINKLNPDLIALSHGISYQCAPLAWLAAKKGIPVIILNGKYGVPRLWRLSKPEDIFFGNGHPSKESFKEIEKEKKIQLSKIGEKYLSKRISGFTKDIAGRHAFQKNNEKLDLLFDKKKYKKVIVIYLSNWFDFPHMYGMSRFTDFLDWITETIKYAKKNKNVFWIIKPHPMEDWYGGLTLKEVLKIKLSNNIIILPNNYSGKSVIEKADALITFHGTSALEFASMGKPVMVADKGWYHEFDFVIYPKSKEEYLKNLTKEWYNSVDIESSTKNARLYTGLYFGIPYWQKNDVLPDDSDRKLLRAYLPRFTKENSKSIKKEVDCLKSWLNSGSIDYHSFKMQKSKKYYSCV